MKQSNFIENQRYKAFSAEMNRRAAVAMAEWQQSRNTFSKSLVVRVNLKTHLIFHPRGNNEPFRVFRKLEQSDAEKLIKSLGSRLERRLDQEAFVFGGLHFDEGHPHIHVIVGCPDGMTLTSLKEFLISFFSRSVCVKKTTAPVLGNDKKPMTWINTQVMKFPVSSSAGYAIKKGTDCALL